MDSYIKAPKIVKERIETYLDKGLRFDGRKSEEFRDLEVEFGISKKAEGSVRVRLGKTEVLVGVKVGLGVPYPDSPNKGGMMVTAELLPMSSKRFELGPPKIRSIELGRVIDRGIRECGAIDFEKLCIIEGEKVWTLFIDLYAINDDGNLLDACGLGAILALKSAKMPKFDTETGKVLYEEHTEEGIPLKSDLPIAITAHKIGKHFVVDPTREEEDCSETRVTIGSTNGAISSMQKGDLQVLTPEEMAQILELNEKVWTVLDKKVKEVLKK